MGDARRSSVKVACLQLRSSKTQRFHFPTCNTLCVAATLDNAAFSVD